jgi:hypothetical protein
VEKQQSSLGAESSLRVKLIMFDDFATILKPGASFTPPYPRPSRTPRRNPAQITMADDENRRELSRLWRVFKTAKQMCHDRVSRPAATARVHSCSFSSSMIGCLLVAHIC